jgi:SAM-dependent methyltransferase
MRPIVRDFVIDLAENLPVGDPILEVGSRPAEGQEDIAFLRNIFPGHEYIGCDIQPGRNVDRIEDVHALTFADNSIGTVICVEVLEHVADPLRAVQEMHRVLRPGGVAIFSSLMFFPIHEHPWDYWRFTPEGFDLVVKPFETSLVVSHGYELLPEAVFAVGVKGPFPDLTIDKLPRTKAAIERWGKHLPVDVGPIRFTVGEVWKLAAKATFDEAKRQAARVRRKVASIRPSR